MREDVQTQINIFIANICILTFCVCILQAVHIYKCRQGSYIGENEWKINATKDCTQAPPISANARTLPPSWEKAANIYHQCA